MLQSKTYYSYDERGNLSGEQTRTYASEGLAGSTAEQAGLSNDANSVKTYHYDRFNRLVEYTDGDTVAKYEYNADNLRTAKTVNGRRTDYVWDGTNLRSETGGNGTHEYVYDPTGVHMMDGNYYVKDGHGNVTGMYDANAEFVSDTYYDAFGNITYGDAPNPFGYSGEYHDSETGLIYLRNRYYDSSTGRFITEDPAKDGVNWYSYCGGDPVNAVDPWGLADVPQGGTEPLVSTIDEIMKIIGFKADYNNDKVEGKTSISAPILANEKREILKSELPFIKSYSPELAALVDEVIISGSGNLQEVSSVLAIFVELKYDITVGEYVEGQEVIPEEKIREKYNYYVSTGNIYLAGSKAVDVLNKILPSSNYDDHVPYQQVFTGMSNWGYWIKVLYYDEYKIGNNDAYNLDTEDWWEDYDIKK